MHATQTEAEPTGADYSHRIPIPYGWQRLTDWPRGTPGYAYALDPDGLIWVPENTRKPSRWTLYVYAFSSPTRQAERRHRRTDTTAHVYTRTGETDLPISPTGIITTPNGRRIRRNQWDH